MYLCFLSFIFIKYLKIVLKAINKLERPSYLCRELKPSCYKQTLQGYEKTQS